MSHLLADRRALLRRVFSPSAVRCGSPPHFHALIVEGGFDSTGQSYHLPIGDTTSMAECLRRRNIALFLKRDLINQPFSETLFPWKHSGFSVDDSVRLDGGDHKAGQALAQYFAGLPCRC